MQQFPIREEGATIRGMDVQGDFSYNNKMNAFSVASFVCGILSVTCCCTGVLSLSFGALGIIFAILTKRLGKPAPLLSSTGMMLSCFGIFLGVIACGIVAYNFVTDEAYRNMVMQYYQQYSTMSY